MFVETGELEVGDIVAHIYRPGFFRVEGVYPEEGYSSRVLIRRVATKGFKMRRESRSYTVNSDVVVHVKRAAEQLESILNQLNPLI